MPPVMQEALDIKIELGKKLEEITAEESQIINQLETRQAQLKQLEEDFALAHDQVKYPIHTAAIGMALREQRQALPSVQNYRRESVQRQVIMGEIRSAQIDLDRQRRELPDLDLATKKVIESVGKIPESDIESLNFELRAFIAEPLNQVQVISDLHRVIDDAFREANIEISFPQRDVHLDQSGPLEVRVLQEQGLKNNSELRAS